MSGLDFDQPSVLKSKKKGEGDAPVSPACRCPPPVEPRTPASGQPRARNRHSASVGLPVRIDQGWLVPVPRPLDDVPHERDHSDERQHRPAGEQHRTYGSQHHGECPCMHGPRRSIAGRRRAVPAAPRANTRGSKVPSYQGPRPHRVSGAQNFRPGWPIAACRNPVPPRFVCATPQRNA